MALGNFIFIPTHSSNSIVRVAVVDTGADVEHPLLRDRIWKNPGEIPGNNLDDDHNGLVDDVHGWNFASSSADLTDHSGHGTHVAGIIKKTMASVGTDSGLELMILKYDRDSFLNALQYAVAMKANIINISGGGPSFRKDEWEVLARAQENGIVIVAAAGNKSPTSSHRDFYPAAYSLPNILSVAALGQNGEILPTSNLNAGKKQKFEVGERVYSSLPGNRFGYLTGSSQAAATATGHLAAQFPVTDVTFIAKK